MFVPAERSWPRGNSNTRRVVRSTSVPIDEREATLPRIKSPSQSPGMARSSTSGGRSAIIAMSLILPLPVTARLCGRRVIRPDRKQATSSLRTHRGHERTAIDRSSRVTRACPCRRGTPTAIFPRSAPENSAARADTRPPSANAGFNTSFSGFGRAARRCVSLICSPGPIPATAAVAGNLATDRRRMTTHTTGDHRERVTVLQAREISSRSASNKRDDDRPSQRGGIPPAWATIRKHSAP